jgi:branched-chain amino acid transport system permease protein
MDLFGSLLQYILSGLVTGSIYALIAIGITIVFNVMDSFNFPQGEYVVYGGMIAIYLTEHFHLPLILTFLLTVLLVMGIVVLSERLTVFPVKNLSHINFLLIAFGVQIFLVRSALLMWGPEPRGLPYFLYGEKTFRFLNTVFNLQGLWVIITGAITVIIFFIFYNFTLFGKAMRACSINKQVATLVGIDEKWMSFTSFLIAGALGAIAGILISPLIVMAYNRGALIGLKGLCASVLGGMGNVVGAIIGGVLLGVFEALGAGYVSSGYKDAFAFLILILVLLIRPLGIMGKKKIREV